MGNNISSTPILPLSFGDCFVNGQLDIKKYQLYLLVKRKQEENVEISFISSLSKANDDERPHKKRKVRLVKKHRIEIPNPDGTVTYMEPNNSLWYLLFIRVEPQSNGQRQKIVKGFA